MEGLSEMAADISQDVLISIFMRISGRDLGMASCVCVAWKEVIIGASTLWRSAFMDEFAAPSSVDDPANNTDWKLRYIYEWQWRNGNMCRQELMSGKPVWAVCGWGNLIGTAFTCEIDVWDWKEGKLEKCLRTAHEGLIVALCMQGMTMCSAGTDNSIKVWDLDKWECKSCMTEQNGYILDLAMDGNFLLSAISHSTSKLWDLSKAICIHRFDREDHCVHRCISISQNNCLAVSVASEARIKIWDLKSQTCLKTIAELSSVVSCLDMSDDFVVAGIGNTVHVFKAPTWEFPLLLSGHTGMVSSVKLSEKRLLSGGDDGTIILWDALAGNLIRKFTQFPENHVACRIKGIVLGNPGFVSGSSNECHGLVVWKCSPGSFRCPRVGN